MYVLQISIEGLAAWLESVFRAKGARFNKIYEVPNPPTTPFMQKLRCLEIQEGGYTVTLLDLNFLIDIRTLGLQKWLKTCEVFYTSYYVDGKRVLEFRRNNGQDDVAVAYAVDNQPAPIAEREVVPESVPVVAE